VFIWLLDRCLPEVGKTRSEKLEIIASF